MLANTPEMLECHFGIPMAGAVINTLNTRLDADAIAFMLGHGVAKVLIADREFSGTVARALAALEEKPFVIDVDDPEYSGAGERIGQVEYERFIAGAIRNFRGSRPPMNGTPFRSTTPRAPPATPRAWSTITAAPI